MHSSGLRLRSICLLGLLCFSLPSVTSGATITWTGATSEDWHTAGNWSGGVPTNGDMVVIAAAARAVTLSSDSADLSSLTLTNNILTFTNWYTKLLCTNVTVQDSGKLALPGRFTEAQMSNRIHVVCVNVIVTEGGMIDADDGGFSPENGPGAPGPTLAGSDDREGGGGYGGKGGSGDRDTAQSYPGAPYASAAMPIQPGSGGGSDAGVLAQAGAGGGAIRIDASGTVRVDGTITSDGGDSQTAFAAAGSGGAIYISCDTFEGSTNGLIKARGGDAFGTVDVAGGGGGGRIAVDYNNVGAEHDVRFSCSPARVEYAAADLDNRWWHRSRMGTLWLPDTNLLATTLSNSQFTDCRIMGITSWSPASLTVSNCSVTFGEYDVVVTVAGNVLVDSGGSLGIGNDWKGSNATLHCGGDLVLTNGGSLWVYAGMTNGAATNYGASVQVTNDLIVGPSSWIYPVSQSMQGDGAPPRFIVGNLAVAKGGGINANSMGYGPNTGPGVGPSSVSGAGHGGRGGANWARDNQLGGIEYGSVTMPLAPGSSSGYHPSHYAVAGSGGGVIWLEVTNTATIHGTLTAKGAHGLGTYGGSGSGGSIYLKCETFGGSTNGLITVQGGDQGLSAYQDRVGAGAGGRIAIDYQGVDAEHDVRFSAAPGDEGWATVVATNWVDVFQFRAQAGTLWLPDTNLLDTVLSDDQFDNVRLFGPTSWSLASLTVSNCWISFCEPGFELTVAGDVVVSTNGVLGIGDESTGSNYALRCQGNVIVTNGGALHVYAGVTNGTGNAYGTLVAATNSLIVAPNSFVYPYAHSTDGGPVKFVVGDVYVANGGAISAYGRGFASMTGPGTADSEGSAGGGGGYGGRGGIGYRTSYGYVGIPYGSPHQPLLPGSGGGSHTGGHTKMGSRGGGVVWIETAGEVIVDGTIDADGQDIIDHTYAGAGSGGAIYIKCNSFGGAASGRLTVDGGAGLNVDRGGGGGGRIAIEYNSLAATYEMGFSAAPALTSWAYHDTTNYWQYLPRPGTLSLPDGELLSATLPNSRLVGPVNMWFQDISEWAVDSLTVTNGWIGFGQDDFLLTVSNDLVITTGGELGIGEYSYGSNITLAVGGSLILTNSGELHVYGGLTNAMGQGDVSAIVAVTNDIVVRSGSWIFPASHDAYGGSPVFRMRHLVIESNAGINADAKGYRSMGGAGRGTAVGSYGYPSGAGYGGVGGGSTNLNDNTGYPGGVTYGQTNGPALPGSGGGTYNTYASDPIKLRQGGVGGGPVRIEARGDVTIDGTITANGTAPEWGTFYYGGSGGSGGGISIITTNFSGNASAVLRVNGSDSFDQDVNRGAGGGGRIVVWDNVPEQNRTNYLAGGSEPDIVLKTTFAKYWGSVAAAPGLGSVPGSEAEAGTFFYIRKAVPGTFELRVEGEPVMYATPSPLDYGVHPDIPSNTWITNTVSSPVDQSNGLRRACLGYELEDGLGNPVTNSTSTQAVFRLTMDHVLTWRWTNEWLLSTDQGANGTVNTGAVNGWYTNGVVAPDIIPTPDSGYMFDTWTGDFPLGQATDDPLSVTMDQARWITGTFAVAVIETNTWTGTGVWSVVTNWSEGHAPKSIDHVVVGSGELTIDLPKTMVSLIVSNGAALVFTNWTTTLNVDDDVTVQSNGLITAYRVPTNGVMSNRVQIICSNLLVEAGGAIDVTGKGYAPWDGPGSAHTHNFPVHSGGSYGGLGGWGHEGGDAEFEGDTYGSVSQPIDLGSGGGSRDDTGGAYPDFRGTYAGWGGGAIRIIASGTVTINGTIGADGGAALDPGTYDYVAGGSGGSIYITCGTLGGSNGTVRARGGNAVHLGDTGGGGGGGRIAVDYNNLAAQRTLHFSAAAGTVDWGRQNEDNYWPWAARMGTLWLSDTNLLASPITDNLFSNCCLVIDGVTTLDMASLTVSNAIFTFMDPGFNLRIAGDLVIGSGGELGIGGYYDEGSNFLLAVGGSLTVTNGGKLHVFAGQTNGTPGDVATLVTVTNDIVIGASSWIVPYCNMTNGSTVRFVAENLAVASGGGIMARGRGYSSKLGPGAAPSTTWSTGASHGGAGGIGASTMFKGTLYDSLHAPIQPGSSSGTYNSNTHWFRAPPGGGAIRLLIRSAITVNGTIDASAAPIVEPYGACGSGGSVYIKCDTFGGAGGLIRADGGSAVGDNDSGPGGGGRIAVDYNSLSGSPTVAFSVTHGSNGWATAAGYEDMRVHHLAQDGTLSLPDTALLSDTLTDALFAGGVRIYFADVSSWNVGSLIVSNCSVNFAHDGFVLTVAGDVRVDAGGILGIGDDPAGSNYVMNCANLTLVNGGMFDPYAGRTNDSSETYGTLIDVSGDITIASNSWIRPWAQRNNGATVLFRARDVTVAPDGGFNADGRGYYSRCGPGRGEVRGDEGSGGGYGGRGGMGKDTLSLPGDPYGSTNAPVEPGSSGGTHGSGYEHRGASGGGSVRVEASGGLTLLGKITASGADAWVAPWTGGGSGGSIYLFCNNFEGSAASRLYAEGGDGSDGRAGPGSGGRIAVWEGISEAQRVTILAGGTPKLLTITNSLSGAFDGTAYVLPGTGYVHATYPAEQGTIRYLTLSRPAGTVFLLR